MRTFSFIHLHEKPFGGLLFVHTWVTGECDFHLDLGLAFHSGGQRVLGEERTIAQMWAESQLLEMNG